ncbi:flagellar biosynthesis protein FlhF [Brevibacillus dissolubilis]|uniref:flagellar biosynthesis protein FlhF n=1 Tax=Brevibacillus dissolubilis TaxID=1844116 RepID=UPI00111672BD|nr:flagellar biosynthesis protein FlhF [Brevibacillus dissolubilis]
MRVKRYVVDSMPDALEKIRLELGKDAIILNTKSVKTGGFLGLFSKQKIEVIAAVDPKASEAPPAEPTIAPQRPKVAPSSAVKKAYQQAPVARTVEPGTVQGQGFEQALATQTVSVQERGASTAVASPPIQQTMVQAPQELDVNVAQAPVAQPAPSAEAPRTEAVLQNAPIRTRETTPRSSGEFNAIASELKDMREMFRKLLLLKQNSENLPPAFIALRDRLIFQEVEEEIVANVLKEILFQTDDPSKMTEEEVMACARGILSGMVEKAVSIPPRIPSTVKYAFFFGPTGVGKTTTIAKLAAETMIKEKRRVGFITSDTYRIAAVEQLKTYGNILNVPLEVVFSSKEIEQAMERLADCDLILIDTAGRNYRNDEYVAGIKEFFRPGEASENYLVLSLTSKYDDMKAIINNFGAFSITKVIFTKADETETYGSILNVISEFGLNLSYLTTGQNVPDDIAIATTEKIVHLILGDKLYA